MSPDFTFVPNTIRVYRSPEGVIHIGTEYRCPSKKRVTVFWHKHRFTESIKALKFLSSVLAAKRPLDMAHWTVKDPRKTRYGG